MPRTDPGLIAQARVLVETSHLSLRAIAGRTGLSTASLSRMTKKQDWLRPQAANRRQLVARLWRTAEQHLAAIDTGLQNGAPPSAARDLAILTKVLRDLAALEQETLLPLPAIVPLDDTDIRGEIRQRLQKLHALDQTAPEGLS